MGEALERGRVGVVSYSWYLPDRWFSHHRVRDRLFSKISCEGQRKLGGPGTRQVQNTRIRALSQCRVLRSCDLSQSHASAAQQVVTTRECELSGIS